MRAAAARWAMVALVTTTAACAVGKGTGSVTGNISLVGCDADLAHYDMQPDFFSATEAHGQLIIRIQPGGYYQEYSDSVTIAVQSYEDINAQIAAGGGSATIPVSLERPPGSAPSVPPPPVRLTLSLRKSCGSDKLNPATDNPYVVLHAVSGTIKFTSILHGDIYSRDTNGKRIEGEFHVELADPRTWGTEAANGQAANGHLDGTFKFFYQRGGPAQPFP